MAAIAWGLLDCFFGYRIFKVTIAVLGGLIGGLLLHAGAQAAGLDGNAQLIGLALGALLGAGLAFLLYLAAVFLAGFGLGATATLLLMAHFDHSVALLASLVVGLIGGYAAVKLQKVVLILATAVLGAFRALLALAYFTSQIDWIYYYRQPQHLPALIDSNAWLLPAVLVLAALGAVAQFDLGGGRSAKKDGKKKKDEAD